MMQLLLLLSNRLAKLLGHLTKILLGYPFHFILPKKRFIIPKYSPALLKKKKQKIPSKIWQTNYSNQVSLPIYLNYLFNRLMSLHYDYHYVSTEERLDFINTYTTKVIYQCYQRLNDGAAQADFWRLLVLNHFGGVYMDIDAHLIFPLSKIIKKTDEELFIFRQKDNAYTNYFIATSPSHPILEKAIKIINDNIINNDKTLGVYSLTGPVPFDQAIKNQQSIVNKKSYRNVCVQGSFTNEYFQYIDKPRGKWIHKKSEEIIKP